MFPPDSCRRCSRSAFFLLFQYTSNRGRGHIGLRGGAGWEIVRAPTAWQTPAGILLRRMGEQRGVGPGAVVAGAAAFFHYMVLEGRQSCLPSIDTWRKYASRRCFPVMALFSLCVLRLVAGFVDRVVRQRGWPGEVSVLCASFSPTQLSGLATRVSNRDNEDDGEENEFGEVVD